MSDAKDEVLQAVTELDLLGYTGGPDKWTRRAHIGEYQINIERTPKGWVVKLQMEGRNMNDEDVLFDRHVHYFKTMSGVVSQARIYTGLQGM